jgi:hypothetical protein
MGEDEFDFGSLFGGGDTDMSNFDMSGLDLGSLADLGDLSNFDIGNLDLSNFDIGDLGNFNLGDLDLGGMDFNGQSGIDIDSILKDLGGDVGGIDPKLLESITGYSPDKSMFSDDAIQTASLNATPVARQELNIAPGDYAPFNVYDQEDMEAGTANQPQSTNVYDQEDMEAGAANQPENIDDVIRQLSGSSYDEDKYAQNNAALEKEFGPDTEESRELKSLQNRYGTAPATEEDREMTSLQKRYGTSTPAAAKEDTMERELASLQNRYGSSLPTNLTSTGKSINEAIASGNSPGTVGAKALVNGDLRPDQAATLLGTNSGLTSLLTSTGKSKNEAIASGMSPGSEGAKAAAAGDLTPEELAAAQGVVTKGSVYNPSTAADKLADKALTAANNKTSTDALKAAAAKALTPAAKDGSNNMSQMMMLLALMALMNKSGGGGGSSGATIPSLSADRKQLPYGGGGSNYRPGQGGVNYFTPTTYSTRAAGGGLMSLNEGGHLGGYSDGGRLLRGPGDGVSDSIPASIGGKQPARLATGEFVVPARIVSELGNGSTDAGAQRLYEMMDRVQHARRKTKNVAANTKAAKYLPA